MSHSFYVENLDSLQYSDVIQSLAIDSVKLTDDSPQPVDNHWPEGESYLYIDQVSLRPIQTSFSGGTFKARVFANSSDEDYRLAIKLVTEIASRNNQKVEPEDNDPLPIQAFLKEYDDVWITEHRATMFGMLIDSFKRSETVSMWGTNREIKAGQRFFGQVLAYGEESLKEYEDRFKLLNYMESQDIYIAHGIRLANDEGKEALVGVLSPEVSTVLFDELDAITLRSDEETIYVGLDVLADILGEKSKWLSEHILYIPAISNQDWIRLMEELKDVASTDAFEFAHPAVNKVKSGDRLKSCFTDEEWRLLLCAPVLVFAAVAGADGEIDKKEIQSFQEQMAISMVSDSKLLQEVIVALLPDIQEYLKRVLGGKVDPVSGFSDMKTLLDNKVDGETGLHFKMELFKMGKSIAESSGGFLGIFGSKISKSEKQALAALAVLLGLVDNQ